MSSRGLIYQGWEANEGHDKRKPGRPRIINTEETKDRRSHLKTIFTNDENQGEIL